MILQYFKIKIMDNINKSCNNIFLMEVLHERTEHLDHIFLFFHPSLNGDLLPVFCLLVEGECQILVF